MPAYTWQTDPFGYMGDKSPNFIMAGQPEYARGDLNNEARRISEGGAPTYNPMIAQGFSNIPAYDINKGQSYGEFLAGETARTQAGANSGPYTNNPTLNWNFLNQNSTAIPTGPFRLPTYQDPQGVNYAIRAGTTALPSWAVNATPNWQQLIGGGAAGWGNPGAPTYQPGQNIFASPPVASQTPTSGSNSRATTSSSSSSTNLGGATFSALNQFSPALSTTPSSRPSGALGGATFSSLNQFSPSFSTTPWSTANQGGAVYGSYMGNMIGRGTNRPAADVDQEVNPNPAPEQINRGDPVQLPPYEVVDYRYRDYEPDTTNMNDLDSFYQTGNPYVSNPRINPETTPEQLASDQLTEAIQRAAETRINNASKVGPVSQADRDRIFQEEATRLVGVQAATNAPQRIIDLSPQGSSTPSAGQIPWVIPISGISPTQAILATILLNQIAGRSGGGAGYGGGTAPATSGSTTGTGSATGSTTTGGDSSTPAAGVVIGTGSRSGDIFSGPAQTQTGTEQPSGPGTAIIGTGVTPSSTPTSTGPLANPNTVEQRTPTGAIVPLGAGTTPTPTRPTGPLANPYGVEPYGTPRAIIPIGAGTTPTPTININTPSTTPIITSTPSNPVTQNTTASLRNLLGEGSTTADALSKILPDIYRLYNQGAGSLAQSDLERLAGITGGNIFGTQNANLTQLAAQQTAAANRALREGNIADAELFSKRADELRRAQNPELYDAMKQQQEVASGQVKTDLDRLAQAQARNLSPEDIRNAQQSAREAYSARGLVMGPGAIGAEILNREALARQREQEARANLQTSLGNLGQTVGYRTANVFDPLGSTLSQQYGMQTGNQGLNQALFNQAAGISSGGYGYNYAQNLVNPFTPYAQDLYGTNVNALNAAAIANANRAAGLEAAKLGQSGTYAQALGSFLGSATGQDIVRRAFQALGG